MKRLSVILIAVAFVISSASAAMSALTADVGSGGMNFGPGDTLQIGIGATNSDTPVAVDAYLALVFPGETLLFLEFTQAGLSASVATTDPSTWKKFLSNLTIPAPFTTELIPIINYTITGFEPTGTYQTVFAFMRAGTMELLAYDIAPFFVGTHPVSGLLGTYTGTWINQTYSTTAAMSFVIADNQPGSLSMTQSIGGAAFGSQSPLPSFVVTADLREAGISLSGGNAGFGTVTGSLSDSGGVLGSITSIPGGSISSVDYTGTINNGALNINYTVNFSAGGKAVGTATAHR